MRAIVQRVAQAKVLVENQIVGECGPGFLVLVAAHRQSTETQARDLADRVAGLRVFNDHHGKMNLALKDLPDPLPGQNQILVVSQFTLYADVYASRRPSFTASAPYEQGEHLYQTFVEALRPLVKGVATGVYGASMQIELTNDGPVTFQIDAR